MDIFFRTATKRFEFHLTDIGQGTQNTRGSIKIKLTKTKLTTTHCHQTTNSRVLSFLEINFTCAKTIFYCLFQQTAKKLLKRDVN